MAPKYIKKCDVNVIFYSENLREYHLGYLGLRERMILKWILKK
jgi:hypothetical protein